MNLRSLFFRVSGIVILCLGLAWNLFGQVGMATLSGTVTDPTGAVIPGAQVNLESATRQATRKTVTNATGQYTIPAILPGTYRLVVSRQGFSSETYTDVNLTSGQGSTLNVTLQLAKAMQQVAVKAAPPLLETTTASVGGEVTERQFTALPLLGRNFTSLIATLPGAASVPSPGYVRSGIENQADVPYVYGQRQRDNNVTVDGVTAREPNFSRIGIIPPPEAIAEMKVLNSNDSGAYGWGPGANINLVTKSGTNQYHADVWEYLRNSALNARSFFLPKVGQFQWNQFGFAGGGPLVIPHVLSKKKAWYVFGWYEGVRIHNAANFTALVPTSAELNGDFSGGAPIYNPYTTTVDANGAIVSRDQFPGNIIPTGSTTVCGPQPTCINPTALALAKTFYPAPNLPSGVIPGKNFISTIPNINTSDQWSARVDHQFGTKHNFYARYSDWRNPQVSTGLPSVPSVTEARWTNAVASDTYTLSPTFLVTGRFGLQRVLYNQFSNGPDVATTTGLTDFPNVFPPFNGFNFLPSFSIPGYPGISEFFGFQGPEYYLSWTGDATKTTGRHTISFGGGFMRDRYFADHTSGYEDFGTGQTAFGSGTGNPLASFLLGLPLDANRQAGITGGHFLFHNYSFYAQDSFHATSKLTVNFGLRWDYISPPDEKPGLGTFDYNTGKYYWDHTNPITGAQPNIRQGLVPPDYNGWQPRMGIAYALTPKMVLRSSFGIFDSVFGSNQQSYTGSRGNWPFAFPQTLAQLNATVPEAFIQDPFPNPPIGSATPLGCGQCANVDPSSTRQPYVEEWSFSLQRQLTRSTMVQASYMGSHGVKLNSQLIDNIATRPSPTGSYQSRQTWPQFPPYIMNGYNEFMSWYDGLSLMLKKSYSKNLSFLVSYTWSKAITQSDTIGNFSPYGGPSYNANRFDMRDFQGPAAFNLPNIFSASYIYRIPWKSGHRLVDGVLANWELSGIVSAHNGVPYFVLLSTDNANMGVVPGRISEWPNLTCNPNTGITQTLGEWFNTGCYQLPAFGTLGNAGRHALYSDSSVNWDSAIVKRWPFGEHRAVEFRAEFFNFLNGHSFAPPNFVYGSSTFGEVSGVTQGGRNIQFALKLHF